MPPRYALTLKRLKDREKALLQELEDNRTTQAACLQAMECPPSLVKEFKRLTDDHIERMERETIPDTDDQKPN
jgi:hypothetical protein